MTARTLYVNSSGSDTQASGCGPSTAVYGTGADTDGTTVVDLSADSPDLSSVAQYDLLWVDTASGAQFAEISSVDNVAKTVTVGQTMVLGTGQNWAIGGKRATLQSLDKFFVYTANPYYICVIVETDQTLTAQFPSTTPNTYNVNAIIGDNGVDSTKIKITFNHTSTYCLIALRQSNYWHNFHFDCPNNNAWLFRDNHGAPQLYDCQVGSRGGANNPVGLMNRVNRYGQITFVRCDLFPSRYGVNGAWTGNTLDSCYVETTTASTGDILFWTKGSGSHSARNCIFKHAGVVFHQNDTTRSWDIAIYNCIIDGASIGTRGQSTIGATVRIANTIFSNCTTAIQPATVSSSTNPYNGNGTSEDWASYYRYGNCFYNNTSDGVTLNATEISDDPGYADAANGDYTVTGSSVLTGGYLRDLGPTANITWPIGTQSSSATGGGASGSSRLVNGGLVD